MEQLNPLYYNIPFWACDLHDILYHSGYSYVWNFGLTDLAFISHIGESVHIREAEL